MSSTQHYFLFRHSSTGSQARILIVTSKTRCYQPSPVVCCTEDKITTAKIVGMPYSFFRRYLLLFTSMTKKKRKRKHSPKSVSFDANKQCDPQCYITTNSTCTDCQPRLKRHLHQYHERSSGAYIIESSCLSLQSSALTDYWRLRPTEGRLRTDMVWSAHACLVRCSFLLLLRLGAPL